jgi:hypothetical protein
MSMPEAVQFLFYDATGRIWSTGRAPMASIEARAAQKPGWFLLLNVHATTSDTVDVNTSPPTVIPWTIPGA